jgi:hypothetical protein
LHTNHLKHMLLGGAAILAVLIIAGVPLASAAPYALVLACPLMMFFMMAGMSHGNHGGNATVNDQSAGPARHHDAQSQTSPSAHGEPGRRV